MPTERDQLDEMSDGELVSYWNILQTPCLKIDPDGDIERHAAIADELLDERGILHETGKRTVHSKECTDHSLDHLIYDEKSPRPR